MQTPSGVRPLQLINAHLEPLSAPHTLWLFKTRVAGRSVPSSICSNRHRSRMTTSPGWCLRRLQHRPSGDKEDGYRHARAWSSSLRGEDRRRTHTMGRLDYLFFRLMTAGFASTQRLDRRFGSDHHPVIGTSRNPDARWPAGLTAQPALVSGARLGYGGRYVAISLDAAYRTVDRPRPGERAGRLARADDSDAYDGPGGHQHADHDARFAAPTHPAPDHCVFCHWLRALATAPRGGAAVRGRAVDLFAPESPTASSEQHPGSLFRLARLRSSDPLRVSFQ